MSPVKAPTAPEEDFFILEDEVPLLFRIPRTMSSSKRNSRTSGTVFDSQTSQRSPEKPSETADTDATEKLHNCVINESKKNTREKVKKTKIPEPPESPAEKQRPPVDRAAVDRLVHEKPIKKQSRVKQVYAEQSGKKDVKPQAGEVLPDLEEPSRKSSKKSQKNIEVKKTNAVKQKKTKVKVGRKGAQVVKEMPHVEDGIEDEQEQSNDDLGPADHPALLSGNI